MAILDKVLFWRHKEAPLESDLGLEKGPDLGLDKTGFEPPETPTQTAPTMEPPGISQQGMPPQGMQQHPTFNPPPPLDKDLELISAKLDSLKAILDNINQRLTEIERIARGGI